MKSFTCLNIDYILLKCTYKDSVCSSMSVPLLVNRFMMVRLLLSLGLSPRPILEDLWTNLRFMCVK